MFAFKKKEEKKYLPSEWIENAELSIQHTKDAPFLERRYNQLLFVYDNMMENRPHHNRLGSDKIKIVPAVLTKDKFALWDKSLGDHTTVIPMDEGTKVAPKHTIRGELYSIRSQQLFVLDNEYQNGLQYNRRLVELVIPVVLARMKSGYKERSHYNHLIEANPVLESVSAWMYVGADDYWGPMVRSSRGTRIRIRNGWDVTETRTYQCPANGLFSPAKVFQPHNPQLEKYYYFTNATNSSNNST